MGGEMLYVLEQRLGAQHVGDQKGVRVLRDVMKATFGATFMDELFKPQDMYRGPATRKIFERLAHSSIMRLNKSSMDKLYDLMAMAVKYQLLLCHQPQDMLTVTMNHLQTLKRMAQGGPVDALLDSVIARVRSIYEPFKLHDWVLLKQMLHRFFQPRNVKVSLFLQGGLQQRDSVIVLCNSGMLPLEGNPPGAIRYMDGRKASFATLHTGEHTEYAEAEAKRVELGGNMYANASHGAKGTGGGAKAKAPAMSPLPAMSAGGPLATSGVADAKPAARGRGAPQEKDTWKANVGSAKEDLNLLAALMGSINASDEKGDGGAAPKMRINLFAEDPFEDYEEPPEPEAKGMNVIEVDATKDYKGASALMAEMKLDNFGDDAPKADKMGKDVDDDDDDDDDLLALMDSAK
eukprot:CAMPEP_0118863248 /NCGR_PEP_ID=MMETSP1163-20130328/8190_1 /TAXON_ID=124430 /ORGANISM="Phaeomonas parva, Strain CCMP2877" /LENGTH=404 /DNA_ID=CAMNT_0006797233 /DNA_START=45 /DNA_END=1259 /DNA_ORIENTATION=-